jgi:hypothetical protein
MIRFTLEESTTSGSADEFAAAQGHLPARVDYFAILDQQRHARYLYPAHGI